MGGNVVTMVGSNSFESTDRNRLIFYAPASAGRFARTVAYATENARKDIRFAIEHVGFGKLTLGDQSNVPRHVSVRWATPLTVDYLVEIVWI